MNNHNLKETLLRSFEQIHQHKPDVIVSTTGQVNIIGEDTDFNGSYSLSIAMDNKVFITASSRQDDKIHLTALNYKNAQIQFSLFDIKPSPIETWCNYLLGVTALLKRGGHSFPGFNAVIGGNIPIGVGLSSSAALLAATSVLLQTLGQFNLDKAESAKICQKAENLFCGVQDGFAKHFTAVSAQKENALLVDSFTLSSQQILLPDNFAILICNIIKLNEFHAFFDKCQKEREDALTILEKFHGKRFGSFANVSLLELSQAGKNLPLALFKQAKHVISENARVIAAVDAMRREDLVGLGTLMNESHESLQSICQTKWNELDLIIKIARQQPGVFGARLMNGGCTVNLVSKHQINRTIQNIKEEYYKQTKISPEIYLATAQEGVTLV